MREFAFANVLSSWLGRGGSRFGTRLRVTISLSAPGAPGAGAELALDGSLDAGGFKNEMPPESNFLCEKSPSSTCNFTR